MHREKDEMHDTPYRRDFLTYDNQLLDGDVFLQVRADDDGEHDGVVRGRDFREVSRLSVRGTDFLLADGHSTPAGRLLLASERFRDRQLRLHFLVSFLCSRP